MHYSLLPTLLLLWTLWDEDEAIPSDSGPSFLPGVPFIHAELRFHDIGSDPREAHDQITHHHLCFSVDIPWSDPNRTTYE